MYPLALPFPDIDPYIFRIGVFGVRWYAAAYIVGILVGWWYAVRLVLNDALWSGTPRPSRAELDDFVLWATLGIVLGGRLGYLLFYNPAHYLAHPAEIPAIWNGGMSFHGGFLGSMLAMWLYARGRAFSVFTLFDVFTAAAPIGLFFGRIANFINAELWGRVTDVPWAVVFPTGGPLGRHPSQLYEAVGEGIVLFLLLAFLIYRRGWLARPGMIAGAFTAGYGVARILVEFFREPDAQIGYLGGLVTMGQVLSVPMVVIGALVAVWAARRTPRASSA
jgi:phosphatidylglycerol:prolipoprotein diacylglycerol transferase